MKNETSRIQIGDTVTWTSQSQGSTTTKTGIVVAVVPPREHPLPYAPKGSKIDASGMPRPKESYLVKAEGRKALYWPHASRLKVVEHPKPSAVAGGRGCEVSKPKHTPGPWHIGKGLAAKIVYGTDGYAVANATVYHGKTTRDQAEANAILIAAAPDLLEALKNLVRYLDETDVDGMTCHAEQMIAAHNAIAKAEGKEDN